MRETIIVQPGDVADPARDKCFQLIQLACAGLQVGTVMAAHIDSLGAVVAFSATDEANADDLIASISRDLADAVKRNWESVREQRGQVVSGGEAYS